MKKEINESVLKNVCAGYSSDENYMHNDSSEPYIHREAENHMYYTDEYEGMVITVK